MNRARLAPLVLLAGCAGGGVTPRATTAPVVVEVEGVPFAAVHVAARPRPYVFPLCAPDGTPLTRAFPMEELDGESRDHPHHQSLWFAHGDVDGLDFWHGAGRRERMELDGPARSSLEDGRRVVRARYRWLADEDTLVAVEEREWRFGEEDGARVVDFSTELAPADGPLVLGDTKEGSFALRVRPALRADGAGRLTNSEGAVGAEAWGRRARWIHDVGEVEGRAYGVALLDHPANPRHPTWWHARSYGLLAANPFGRRAFEGASAEPGALVVAPGERLRLAYRVLLHGEGWDDARVEAAWRRWAGAPR